MFMPILFIVIGLVLLAGGGELLLRGAVSFARLLKLSPALVGLTIVAAATSVPELAVSLSAAIKGSSDIAVGNVVGSNIVNITLILGVAALIGGLAIGGRTIKLEYPVLALITWAFIVLAKDGLIDGFDGSLLLVIYVLFTVYMVSLVRGQMTPQEEADFAAESQKMGGRGGFVPASLFLVAGIALLWGGAEVTVAGAIDIAKTFGMSDRVVGLTIVAVGTSLPEIVASVISSLKGRDDVAVGNLIGSNLFNVLVILGITALVKPIGINPDIITSDNWWMLAATLLIFPFMYTHLRISRLEGGVLVGFYAIYVAILLGRA
jgi:cation:H+ antiporter